MITKKTLPLLLAGLLVSAGAFAQASSSGDSSMTAQPGSPSQSMSGGSAPMAGSGAAGASGAAGTSGATGSYGGSSASGGTGASGSTGSPSTMGAGAAPRTPDIVVIQPTVAVPVPVYVQRDARAERYSPTRAVDTGSGTLESNMGPYDPTWSNAERSRAGSY